jgi:hypothetical protein
MNFPTAGHFAAMTSSSQLLLIFFRNRLQVSANRSGVKDCFCYIGTYIILIISCGTAYVLYCVQVRLRPPAHSFFCLNTPHYGTGISKRFLSAKQSQFRRNESKFLSAPVFIGIIFFSENGNPTLKVGSYAYFVESSAI